MKNFKRCCLGLLVILSFFSFSNFIYADTYDYVLGNYNICYNASTGDYGGAILRTSGTCPSGYNADAVKEIDGGLAYCVERSLPIESATYELDSSWGEYWDYAIAAGLMVKEMENLYGDFYERYAMTGAILNTYFSKERGFSASYDFYSNAKIKSVYDSVKQKMYDLDISGNIPAPEVTINGNTMNTLKNFYISNKVTLSGLYSSYGGYYNDSQVTYTITATAESGKAEICTDPLGNNCADSKKINPTSDSSTYAFYVKVSSVDGTEIVSGSSVEVNVHVENGSWFPTVLKYVNVDHDNNQDLVKLDQVWYKRENDKTLYLSIQNSVNHVITIQKVDEKGKSLKGASLEIYRDSYEVSSNLLKANQNGAARFSYTSETVAENEDDFFAHDYYLVEKSAPDGYVLQSQVNHFYLKGTSSNKTSICYYNGGADSSESKEEKDSERCNFANYDYMCKASDGSGFKELNEDGTCNFEVVLPEEDETGGENGDGGNTDTTTPGEDDSESGTENDEVATVDETGDEGNTESDDAGNEDGNDDNTDGEDTEDSDDDLDNEDPEVSVVTYESVCYKKSTGEEVDKSYCDDKANYTKVTLSNGNLTVTQMNPKNLIRISKQAVGGEDELTGAVLKICTAADYETNKEKCSATKTVDDVEMSWISGVQPYEIVGVKKGDYYIVEVTSPNGYISLDTAIAFSIDETGTVKTNDETITYDDFKKNNGAIVIKNKLNSITVSKQDVDTSEELAGATLSICRTYVDKNGEYQLLTDQYSDECIVAMLYNGKRATWKSTDQAKEIKGLKAGTYYLVEKSAPDGYNTTESILFTLKADGTLVDKDGNVLTDNKVVMKDKAIEEVKTGEFSKYTVIIILVVAVGLGISSYCFLKMGKSMNFDSTGSGSRAKKIRKRKIHK